MADKKMDINFYSRQCGKSARMIGELTTKLAAAQAVIDKLPVYADTGEPFVPDADMAWVICHGEPRRVIGMGCWGVISGKWFFIVGVDGYGSHGPAYTTPAAALAAKEAGK